MSDNPTTVSTYQLPEPTTAELDDLVEKLGLIDPDKEGVDPSDFRVFYKKTGLGHIEKRLQRLVDTNRVRKIRVSNGRVMLTKYVLV